MNIRTKKRSNLLNVNSLSWIVLKIFQAFKHNQQDMNFIVRLQFMNNLVLKKWTEKKNL